MPKAPKRVTGSRIIEGAVVHVDGDIEGRHATVTHRDRNALIVAYEDGQLRLAMVSEVKLIPPWQEGPRKKR